MLDALFGKTWLFVATLTFVGLAVGSFLNVVIHRLPRMLERQWRAECAQLAGQPPAEETRYDLFLPGSACPACNAPIRWWQNLPLVSYLLLRGRCASCGKAISPRYPLVETAAGTLAATIAWLFGPTLACLAALVFAWALLALAVIDLDTQLLPDAITLPLIWLGLLANHASAFVPLETALLGAVGGYLTLWSVYWLFKLVTGKEGMGYGDFKLLAAIGALLGWQMLPLVILASSLVGATVGIGLIVLRGHDRQIPIPFGPYLAGGGLVALLWGPQLSRLYLGG